MRAPLWIATASLWCIFAWKIPANLLSLNAELFPALEAATIPRRPLGDIAVVVIIMLPNLLGAMLVRLLDWDQTPHSSISRNASSLLMPVWRAAAAIAALAALLPAPVLAAAEASSRGVACVLLSTMALSVSALQFVLCFAPLSLANSELEPHQPARLSRLIAILIGGLWFVPVACALWFLLPLIQLDMLALFMSGARSADDTRRVMFLLHGTVFTVLAPGIVFWRAGRQRALQFLELNIDFLPLPALRKMRG
ncbi:MAG: hypothetical protein HY553_18290 [Elusimicrobia bacterium]|nr:hypothetical protein [Elusimicrobiota bacterium]